MINETLREATEKMKKAVEVTREDFANIRAGRARHTHSDPAIGVVHGS